MLDRSRKGQASRHRQKIGELVAELGQLAELAKGYGPLARASLYAYRRKCGKRTCRCAGGALHAGHALSARESGRHRVLLLNEALRSELEGPVRAYRRLRQGRAQMVRTFGELLQQMDKLERLRAIDLGRLKRLGRSPSV